MLNNIEATVEPPDPKQVAADKIENDEWRIANEAAAKAQVAAKKSAYKKLAALGLTADEIAAL